MYFFIDFFFFEKAALDLMFKLSLKDYQINPNNPVNSFLQLDFRGQNKLLSF